LEKDVEFPAKVHGVKRVSALYQLPFWRVSDSDYSGMHGTYVYACESFSAIRLNKVKFYEEFNPCVSIEHVVLKRSCSIMSHKST
jgi:hypothetical protein